MQTMKTMQSMQAMQEKKITGVYRPGFEFLMQF